MNGVVKAVDAKGGPAVCRGTLPGAIASGKRPPHQHLRFDTEGPVLYHSAAYVDEPARSVGCLAHGRGAARR